MKAVKAKRNIGSNIGIVFLLLYKFKNSIYVAIIFHYSVRKHEFKFFFLHSSYTLSQLNTRKFNRYSSTHFTMEFFRIVFRYLWMHTSRINDLILDPKWPRTKSGFRIRERSICSILDVCCNNNFKWNEEIIVGNVNI